MASILRSFKHIFPDDHSGVHHVLSSMVSEPCMKDLTEKALEAKATAHANMDRDNFPLRLFLDGIQEELIQG